MDYHKKIHDLLALAESPNEHEARAALLKARELMVKYKISEMDIKDKGKQEVVRELSGITFSMRRNPWAMALAQTVAKHHCCQNFQHREKGKQTAEIGFIGLTDDVPACMEIFLYAYDCVYQQAKKLKKTSTGMADGYGYGFATGLNEAYERQQRDEKDWGLVMVMPKDVEEYIKDIPRVKNVHAHTDRMHKSNTRYYLKGLADGRKFEEQKRIKEEAE